MTVTTSDSMVEVELHIKRYNPDVDDRPHWETYRVQCEPSDRVLDALHKVKWELDGTLSFRRSCAHGVCGSDAVMINGSNALACTTLISSVGTRIRIEAIRGLPVIKDLVVDMEPFFAQYRSVAPYLIAQDNSGERERLQTPAERARLDESTKCILCAACTTSCPVFWMNGTYVGPAALVQAHRFLFDSRDIATDQRLARLSETDAAFRCRTAFNCSAACPRDIPVTQLIGQVKQAIIRNGTT